LERRVLAQAAAQWSARSPHRAAIGHSLRQQRAGRVLDAQVALAVVQGEWAVAADAMRPQDSANQPTANPPYELGGCAIYRWWKKTAATLLL